MSAMGLALVCWLDLNEYARTCSEAHRYVKSYWTRGFLLVVSITFGVTIGYSRLFLGVHSMDQILYGWSLGIWCALTF